MLNSSTQRKTASTITAIRFLIAAMAIFITAWLLWLPSPALSTATNEWLRDNFIRLHSSSLAEARFTIVDIDEHSLAATAPWPWPRTQLADLLETLVSDYGARGVALDIALPEKADTDGDARLASLAEHAPVVLALAFDYVRRPQPLAIGQVAGGSTGTNAPAQPATGYIGNHAGLGNARFTGNIGFIPDADGAIRRLPLITSHAGRYYPTLSLALFDCCAHAPAQPAFSGMALARIPYGRNWSAYTVIPAADILSLQAPAELLQGRLVLVGSSALGLSDRVATPLSSSTSGVMVHAAMLTSLLDSASNAAPAPWPGHWIALGFTMLTVFFVTYAFPRRSALFNIALLLIAACSWLCLAYLTSAHDLNFPVSAPLFSLLFLLVAAIPFDWQLAQRKSRQLLNTLRHYVAPAVVDELLRSDLKDPLLPRRLVVTTLIADMQGYTTQVESLSMEESADLTRDFLDCLTQPVLEHFGTIDKFTGDGLVAFWGAPLPVDDHADLALDAAKKIVTKVHEFSAQRQQAGKAPLRVRIGIESGVAMAGDFGSSARSIYTAVGDSVNVASRLEQQARNFPHDIIIGDGTVSMSKRHHFLALGEVTLRGKEKPSQLFTLKPADNSASL